MSEPSTNPKRLLLLLVFMAALIALGVLIARDKMNPMLDQNGDGKPDEWYRYTFGGELVSLEKDRNYDGTVDHRESFVGGVIAESMTDMNNDGNSEIRGKYDEKGRLIRLDRDLNEDGRYDRFTTIDAETEKQLYSESDQDGDGEPDTRLAPGAEADK
ncbi:MAG: hypothetical protein IT350_14490 [Deltaproteobacteria bacterium]|nr:hypothetical protein [Deltaproteobacteria bacterium]